MRTKDGNPIALIWGVEDTEMMEVRKSGVLRTFPLILIVVLFCPFAYIGMAMHSVMDDEEKFSE